MNLSCYIIDDEPHAIQVIAGYIEKTPGLNLIGTACDPLTALGEYRPGTSPDLTFLDIDMPHISGMDMATLIGKETTVIFTTSFREYAVDAYEKDAADYLMKPVSYERFLACIHRISVRRPFPALPEKDFFFVSSEVKGKMIRITISDITHITGLDNYVEIHLKRDKVIAYLTLTELLEHLPRGKFSRIQKSVIVAHDFIQEVEHFRVRLHDHTVLPIGRVYYNDFLKDMQSVLLVSKRKQS